jgi:hypothetical protein
MVGDLLNAMFSIPQHISSPAAFVIIDKQNKAKNKKTMNKICPVIVGIAVWR